MLHLTAALLGTVENLRRAETSAAPASAEPSLAFSSSCTSPDNDMHIYNTVTKGVGTSAAAAPSTTTGCEGQATSSSSLAGEETRHTRLALTDAEIASLDSDALEALLQEVPEYSWEDQAKAPVPPRLAPPALYVRVAAAASVSTTTTTSDLLRSRSTSNVYGLAGSLGRQWDDNEEETGQHHGGSRPKRSDKNRKGGPVLGRPVIPRDEWEPRTFPFGHAPHYPPKPVEPLLLMEYNTGNKTQPRNGSGVAADADAGGSIGPAYPMCEPPLMGIISSPYVRIPPYTFCARTSMNWRRNRILRSRCHMSHLPFFGEDNYEDETEFRDMLTTSRGKLAYHVPNEDEVDMLPDEPEDELCGICLARGCIAHHAAPAVPLPQPHGDADAGGSSSVTLETSFSLASSTSASAANLSTAVGQRNRFAMPRRRNRERANTGCSADCALRSSEEGASGNSSRASKPYEIWSKRDKEELSTIVAALTQDAPCCTIAAFMANRTCRDVDAALKARAQKAANRVTSNATVREATEGEYWPNKKHKRTDSGPGGAHEKRTQKEIEPFWEIGGEAEEISTEEQQMRVPRISLPWQPCHHPGRPCSSFTGREDPGPDETDPWCACKRNGTWCEPGCGCPLDCGERFKGCECASNGKECKPSQEDSKGRVLLGCPCIAHMRECHPEICAGHADKTCKAMAVQGDQAVRTFVGPSDLEGYGLFVGEDVALSRIYVGEYRGELINEHEAQMRSLLYQTRARSFLFDVTKWGIVDGLRLGNKTRYMNTSRTKKNHCKGESIMINGDAKLIVHATKLDGRISSLKKNDELFLDYGGNFELFGEE